MSSFGDHCSQLSSLWWCQPIALQPQTHQQRSFPVNSVRTDWKRSFHTTRNILLDDKSTSSKGDTNTNANASLGTQGVEEDDVLTLTIPGAQTGGRKLAIIFTCTVCNTRSAKQFTEQAYNHGVVLVRCPGCQNLHLIADRLGYFEDGGDWDLEKIAKLTGQDNVKTVTEDNVLEITLEDIIGTDKMQELVKSTQNDDAPSSTEGKSAK